MRSAWDIARFTFREAVRRRVIVAALIIGLIFLIVYSVGFSMLKGEFERNNQKDIFYTLVSKEMFNFMFLAGLYTVNFLCVAMAALLAADTLAGEINTGTVQTVAAKPIRRSSVVLGKWLGFAGLLGLYLLLMAGGVAVCVFLISGSTASNWQVGLVLIYLESLVVMSLTLLFSSRFSALATGALVFGMYGLAFIGGWIEQFGSMANSQTAIQVGVVSSLIMPSEAIWRRAAFEMQSALVGISTMTPFSAISVPSPVMVGYAVLYMTVMLAFAIYNFAHRDL